MTAVLGIHHVTAIASDPQRNLDFSRPVPEAPGRSITWPGGLRTTPRRSSCARG